MDSIVKILLTTVYVVLMALRSYGQYGNRYMQRGVAHEFDGFDQGKYLGHVLPYSQINGQGYNLGWSGYQGGNSFNPYQKLGYEHQNQGYNGGIRLADGQLFGVQQPVNFIGSHQRYRL
ncbi:uncharacterized protein LOC112594055 [Melanaphis sacchari]|uniref:uncharacterized protein LOC112594055 n=1 Tax=Melanaphis sacchari TaxID=742174 RepID=UPI000DC13893|nr:uncharacterized protein LOC112594055 [Melanaphis sacchari]XP_025194451.1 uncharacterized protein LOC112594055 [Melanaphis sacchari]